MKNIIKTIILMGFMIGITTSCHKDLDVEYLNQADREDVSSDGDNIYSLANGTFYNWYMTVTSSISPRMAMWVMADQGTCSWANSGMYHLSDEPRVGFNNTTSYTYANIFETFYEDIYGTLFMANTALSAINDGIEIGKDGEDTQQIKAMSFFIQGISLGYIGLTYDKAYIMTENTDYEDTNIPTSSYQDILNQAVISLDSCIAVCENSNFKTEDTWINGSQYTDEELAQLARSFAARFLVYGSRNATENEAVNWNKVLNYTSNGIERDLAPYMDNVNWKCWYKYYTVRPGWARIDCRIINLMDPRYPWRYPEDGSNPGRAQSDDNRLSTDFTYESTNNMKPERGYYHYSNYEYTRTSYAITTHTGNVVDFPVTENDLLKAEAYLHLGNTAAAIEIINSGSRILRGGLPPLPANSNYDRVMDAIFYERDIELIQTGFGNAFFDMRRRDMLQLGTMLHFPIPAKELMVMGMPEYTFGGVENADGINVSNGGWFPNK